MALQYLVPMLRVCDVEASMRFYGLLGFAVGNTHAPEGVNKPVWAWLERGAAQIMVANATEPVDPARQGVIFYMYCPDVAAFRGTLLAAGIEAGPIEYPFYAPRGQFELRDPDGYLLIVMHT